MASINCHNHHEQTSPTQTGKAAAGRRPYRHPLADAHLHRDHVLQSRTAPDSKSGLRSGNEVLDQSGQHQQHRKRDSQHLSPHGHQGR